MNLNKKNLKKIEGDASFRIFYREKNRKNKKSSILVYTTKDKEKNLLIYDSINKLLIKKKILAPKLYSENYNNNYITIQDFGNKTLFKILKNKKINNIKLFKKILILLSNIQKIKQNRIKNFKGKYYKVPIYSKKKLLEETELFLKWYVPDVLPKKKVSNVNKKLKKKIFYLLSKIKLPNKTFVHRDFHISNIMKFKNKLALIDSQDAVYGNRAYDLASLIDDVRFQTSNRFKNQIYKYYLNINKGKINKKSFKNDFEILSVLRNLKIIGIFTRLSKRDNKKKYLKLIPYAWKLIEFRINNNPYFDDLKNCLKTNFSYKIRRKNEN